MSAGNGGIYPPQSCGTITGIAKSAAGPARRNLFTMSDMSSDFLNWRSVGITPTSAEFSNGT